MKQKDVWNSIAESWNNFKVRPFPPTIYKLADLWKPGKILDTGCGNGRNLIPFAKNKFDCYGIDFSKKMIKSAKKSFLKNKLKAKFKIVELTKLPFKDETFDYVIYTASLHHLNKKSQIKSLREIKRILKPKGKFYISVWNKWQPRFIFKKKEQFIPWGRGSKKFLRYYYLFNLFELKNILKNNGFSIEKSFGLFGRNVETIVEK